MTAGMLSQKPHLGPKLGRPPKSAVARAAERWFLRKKPPVCTTTASDKVFPGQYYDVETGLNYNWNRYYDPELGRYITSDPIGISSGLNTYLYAGANSLSNLDIFGLYENIYMHGHGNYSDQWQGSGDKCPKWSGDFLIGWFPCDCPYASTQSGSSGGPDTGPGSGAQPDPAPHYYPGAPAVPGSSGGHFSPEELKQWHEEDKKYWDKINEEHRENRNKCFKEAVVVGVILHGGKYGVEKVLIKKGLVKAAEYFSGIGEIIWVYDGLEVLSCYAENPIYTY